MLILTCKLGNEIINCYDGTHDKEQLKKWSTKKILLCPVCVKPYEYCHGKVKTPYFRHMDKNECEDRFSESETEEHLNGKRDLFEWIKKQEGVTNAVLEGWIPETKQRPDIMFEYGDKKYVIEYQCSPIATEYIERHDLYRAVGIIDIWICGTEKYLQKNMRDKYLESMCVGYYNSRTQQFIYSSECNTHSLLNMFSFKFGFETNYYKPTERRKGIRLYSKFLVDLHFNGCISCNTLPDKTLIEEKREFRNKYHEWSNNLWRKDISDKLDRFCNDLSNDKFQYSYEYKYNHITLTCEIKYKGYCNHSTIDFYPYLSDTTNVFAKLNEYTKATHNSYNSFVEKMPELHHQYYKLFNLLKRQRLTIIKYQDRGKASKTGIQYKRVKDNTHVCNWEYFGESNFDNESFYFSGLENEFISNLYEALKFLKIYNFDYVISIPNDRIAGYSGIYDFDKNEDIETYFTKILGFENMEIYK